MSKRIVWIADSTAFEQAGQTFPDTYEHMQRVQFQ